MIRWVSKNNMKKSRLVANRKRHISTFIRLFGFDLFKVFPYEVCIEVGFEVEDCHVEFTLEHGWECRRNFS